MAEGAFQARLGFERQNMGAARIVMTGSTDRGIQRREEEDGEEEEGWVRVRRRDGAKASLFNHFTKTKMSSCSRLSRTV